ncbi:NAD(+) diphosphatase [Kluyveromyces lactis]|uniref:NAD(+) diphosphatase n=1 Tax=Kluyveromyces lactis (strain ATCC 8585 / CBS 2359 / DSM 70799 / NBRC 1267 / NRRL Y-1140 / WM37) TaxID=284590 RepID=Q6CS84_KLULA|nr:uncharacterized protein KLLA0_D03146g [Kluyveromyces lactis]CAH00301.1 KLLA0D03146p [Kluyveromyces lactis]|eukprot:XP_453205.1 uncharacterized protein KLLA0_D03146g [Kluyveromyces lactis]
MERSVTFFGLETINRVSFLRDDEVFIKQAFEHGSTQFVPFINGAAFATETSDKSGTNLLMLGHQGCPNYSEWPGLLNKIRSVMDTERGWLVESGFTITFLGLMDGDSSFSYKEYTGTPLFAMDLRPASDTLVQKSETKFILDQYEPLGRMQAFNLSNEVASLFSHANMYLDWLRKFLFCPGCASKVFPVHGGTKLQCGNNDESVKCSVRDAAVSNVCFPRTDPVVIVAIVDRCFSKICLARSRRKHGNAVMYSTIAGFMEPAETVEHACQREIWEETGIKVELNDVDILFTQPWPYPCNLMIGCLGLIDFNGDNEIINLEHDKELLDAQWFEMELVSQAFERYGKAPKGLVNFDDRITFPGDTAIAHQLIEHAVIKYKRFNGHL